MRLAEIHVIWSVTVTVRFGPEILFALEMKGQHWISLLVFLSRFYETRSGCEKISAVIGSRWSKFFLVSLHFCRVMIVVLIVGGLTVRAVCSYG